MVSDAGHPRLGLVVPRYQSSAVARNRLRRQLKEIWRRAGLAGNCGVDVVIRVKREAYQAPRPELATAIAQWKARTERTGG